MVLHGMRCPSLKCVSSTLFNCSCVPGGLWMRDINNHSFNSAGLVFLALSSLLSTLSVLYNLWVFHLFTSFSYCSRAQSIWGKFIAIPSRPDPLIKKDQCIFFSFFPIRLLLLIYLSSICEFPLPSFSSWLCFSWQY